MKVESVRVSDFMGIEFVELTGLGEVVEVGGKNAQGKSSLFNAIQVALEGKKSDAFPSTPVKRGKEKSRIELELSEDNVLKLPACTIIVNISKGTYKLDIKTKDGMKPTSPQAYLDGVRGTLGFDPAKFLALTPKEQVDALRKLVGLDFAALDAEYDKVYQQRTDEGRIGKELKARLEGSTWPATIPAQSVSVKELMGKLREAEEINKNNDKMRDELSTYLRKEIDAHEKMVRLEKELAAARQDFEAIRSTVQSFEGSVMCLEDIDTTSIKQQIEDAEQVNSAYTAGQEMKALEQRIAEKRKDWEKCDSRLREIADEKKKMMEGAKWPIEGLSFGEYGVEFQGTPISQISTAQQIQVSTAIGVAMNPALKCMFIRNGSMLDEDTLALYIASCKEKGAQLFIEKVGVNCGAQIIIENGRVKGADSHKESEEFEEVSA